MWKTINDRFFLPLRRRDRSSKGVPGDRRALRIADQQQSRVCFNYRPTWHDDEPWPSDHSVFIRRKIRDVHAAYPSITGGGPENWSFLPGRLSQLKALGRPRAKLLCWPSRTEGEAVVFPYWKFFRPMRRRRRKGKRGRAGKRSGRLRFISSRMKP